MNYFAHGFRFIDRPYFLAGTAVPDWLSVADRATRMRTPTVAPFADGTDSPQAEVAAGILQHLSDDQWFHNTRAFFEVTGELTRHFREILVGRDDHHPSFLGHIVTELILDGILVRRDESLLERYYQAMRQISPQIVQEIVNRMVKQPTSRLAMFIPLFQQEGFLWDYLQPDRMLVRLNQVLRRVKLGSLPLEAERVLATAWTVVESRAGELLPGLL
jgi:hypothetical protein